MGVQGLSGRGLPDLDGPLQAARGEMQAIGAERHCHGPAGGRHELTLEPASPGIPDPDDRALAGRGEPPAIGTVRDAVDDLGVALERAEADLLAGRHVPDPHLVGVVARDQPVPVGAEGHAPHLAFEVSQSQRAN